MVAALQHPLHLPHGVRMLPRLVVTLLLASDVRVARGTKKINEKRKATNGGGNKKKNVYDRQVSRQTGRPTIRMGLESRLRTSNMATEPSYKPMHVRWI